MSTVESSLSSEVKAIEKKLGVWLDPAHLTLLVLLAVAVLAGVYLFDSKRADRAEAKAALATAVSEQAQKAAADSDKRNTDFQAQTTIQLGQLKAANDALTVANGKLAAAMQAETVALANQQKANAQMTPTEQSKRWQILVPQATVVPTPAGFTLDPPSGLATLNALENLPVLTHKVEELNQTIHNDEQVISNDAVALGKEKDAHTSDVVNDATKLDAANKKTAAVQADLDSLKAKHQKGMIKSFVAGFVTGIIFHYIKL